MREIKFRTYIKSLKWIVQVERICFDIGTVEVDLTGGNGITSEYYFEEVELMQYTGLKDKNGVEVYEGDILTVEKHNKIGVVKFDEQVCSFELCNEDNEESLYLIQNAFIEYRVIGNIYENSIIYSSTK